MRYFNQYFVSFFSFSLIFCSHSKRKIISRENKNAIFAKRMDGAGRLLADAAGCLLQDLWFAARTLSLLVGPATR